MAPFVIGRDPWDTEAIARDVYRTGLWDYRSTTGNFAFAGIDMALWDLCGKECGQPLYRLFGGRDAERGRLFLLPRRRARPRRSRRSAGTASRAATASTTSRSASMPRAEEAMLEAAARRRSGPTGKIRIDANEAWSVAEAVAAADPLARAVRHRLRRGAGAEPSRSTSCRPAAPDAVALCANEGLGSAGRRAADDRERRRPTCFASAATGSARSAASTRSRTSRICAGIGVCKHTHGELGIAAAAAHHMMLTLPNATDGAQQTASIMADDMLAEPLPIAAGPRWGMPRRPGLGVEVDEDEARALPRQPTGATASSCPTARDEEDFEPMKHVVKTHLPSEDAADRMGRHGRRHALHGADPDPRRTARSRPATSTPQAELTFANLKRTLKAAGGTLEDVTQVLVYLTDKAAFPGHERGLSPLFREALSEPRHRDRRRADGARRGDRDRRLRASEARREPRCASSSWVRASSATTTAYYLAERGHEVTVDRPRSRARAGDELRQWRALITPSTSDSWAAPGTPLKDPEMAGPRGCADAAAPPRGAGHAGWGLRFLRECSEPALARQHPSHLCARDA